MRNAANHLNHYHLYQNDLLREMYLENSASAITYTTASLSTASPRQGLFCMKTGKGDKYIILLSSADEMLLHDNCEFNLLQAYGHSQQGNRGLGYIRDMNSSPCPVIWYSIGALTIRKELCLCPTQPELMIRYTIEEGPHNAEFIFKPFLAFRNAMPMNKGLGNNGYQCRISGKKQVRITVKDPGYPGLWMEATGNTIFLESPEWRFGVKYRKENSEMNYFAEDLFSPGSFKSLVSSGDSVLFSISTLEQHHVSADEFAIPHRMLQ